MITFRDPPPLAVRVKSMKELQPASPIFESPLIPWLVGLLLLTAGGLIASKQRHQRSERAMLAAAMNNSQPREAERGVLAVLPIGTSINVVRTRLDDIRAPCRQRGSPDTTLTCLAFPIVRANTYARLTVRFSSHDQKLTAVEACPTFVHWSRTPEPAALAVRVEQSSANGCWRDQANVADNEWSFAILPDHPFTMAVVHGADSVRRKDAATRDTLIVRW